MEISRYSDTKQQELDELAIAIHIELNYFTKALDEVGGVMISYTISHSYKVKDAVIAFLMRYHRYKNTNRDVMWEGKYIPGYEITSMVMEVLNIIEETSNFKIVDSNINL